VRVKWPVRLGLLNWSNFVNRPQYPPKDLTRGKGKVVGKNRGGCGSQGEVYGKNEPRIFSEESRGLRREKARSRLSKKKERLTTSGRPGKAGSGIIIESKIKGMGEVNRGERVSRSFCFAGKRREGKAAGQSERDKIQRGTNLTTQEGEGSTVAE